MFFHYRVLTALAVLILLAACGHSTTVPALQNPTTESVPVTSNSAGTFVQYTLPAGINPTDLTHGPYGTLWFAPKLNRDSPPPPAVYEMVKATGNVHKFAVPNPDGTFTSWGSSVISAARAVFFFLARGPAEPENFLAKITPEGVVSDVALGVADSPSSQLVVGPDGNIWFWTCLDDKCGDFGSLTSRTPNLTPASGGSALFLFPNGLTPGPGGNVYVTGTVNIPTVSCSACGLVDVFTTHGVLLHQFRLPENARPQGIVTGSDHNLWITEAGINKVARMTPTGVVSQFSIPTASAGLDRITSGWDNALWFTESNANRIGRITTTGIVTEYRIPIPSAFPTGIVTCASTFCPPHGGVWFTETNANKIGKFIAP